jgi:hypothetical protein
MGGVKKNSAKKVSDDTRRYDEQRYGCPKDEFVAALESAHPCARCGNEPDIGFNKFLITHALICLRCQRSGPGMSRLLLAVKAWNLFNGKKEEVFIGVGGEPWVVTWPLLLNWTSACEGEEKKK